MLQEQSSSKGNIYGDWSTTLATLKNGPYYGASLHFIKHLMSSFSTPYKAERRKVMIFVLFTSNEHLIGLIGSSPELVERWVAI